MKQEDIFKKVGNILQELNEQYQYIENTKDNLNDLELELFAANTNFLIENIEVLRKHNKQKPAPIALPEPETVKDEPAPFTEKFFEPVVQPAQMFWPEKKSASAKNDTIEDTPAPEPVEEKPTEEPIIRHELIIDDLEYDEDDIAFDEGDIAFDEDDMARIPEAVSHPEPVEEIIEEAPVEAPKPEVPPVKKETSTINEIIAAQLRNTRLADKLDPPAIKDLKGAINLNDKLLYVKDLFNGYSMAYSEAMDILNRFNKFEEAQAFLNNNYVKKNNWETKPATAERFYELLRHRYPD